MKNGLFKKSMSVFLAMLMLLTCWVWVAPTEAEAADSNSPTAVINTSKISGLSEASFNNALKYTAISGKFHGDDATATANKGYFKNVLYSPHYGTSVNSDYAVSFGKLTDDKADGARVWYPETTLIYDGSDTIPQIGILFDIDSATTKTWYGTVNGVRVKVNQVYMSDNADGLSIPSDFWMLKSTVSDNASDTTYYTHFTFNYILDNLQSTAYVGTRSDKSNGSQCAKNGGWDIYAAYLQYTGGAFGSGNTYYKAIKPKWKITTENAGENTVQAEKTIYVIDVVPLKNALSGAKTLYNNIKSDPGRYTPSSVASFVTMANNLISAANVGNYINSSGNNVTGWNAAVSSALSAYNSFKLEERTFEVTYENLFMLSDWANSDSVTPNDSTLGAVKPDLSKGTITVNTTGTEVYSNYGSATNHYSIPVKGNTEYTFEANMKLDAGTQGQMFVFFYDASGNGISGSIYNGATQTAPHIGIYPTASGVHKITFTTPATCRKIGMRVGATEVGTTATYSNIRLYKTSRATASDFDSWQKVYRINAPSKGSDLYTPTRTGYTFDGWYYDEACTNAVGANDTFTKSTTVYAQWKVNKYTVTWKNDDGKVLKTDTYNYNSNPSTPANTAAFNDESGHHTFAWPEVSKVTANVTYTEIETVVPHEYNRTVATATYKATDATCTEKATYYYSCTCGAKGTATFESGEPNGHDFDTTVKAKDATCTEDGNKAYKQCTVCSLYFDGDAAETATDGEKDTTSFVLGSTGHNMVAGEVVAPTCTVDGYTVYTCSNGCGTTENRDTVTATGHVYTETVTAPTCTDKGYTTHTCACGDSRVDTYVDATGHTYTYTSTNDGKHTIGCSNADCTYNETADCADADDNCKCDKCGYVDATFHNPGDAATCTTAQTCTVCGAELNPAKGHTEVKIPAVDATCIATGLTAGVKCSVCGVTITAQTVTPMIAHTYGELIKEVPATCKKEGTVAHYSCSYCSKNFDADKVEITDLTISINPDNHNMVKTSDSVAPTCTADGKEAIFTCEYCDHKNGGEVIKSEGHVWSTEYTKVSDSENGEHSRSCTKCGEVEKSAHTWSEGVINPDSTCAEPGTETFTCTAHNCGATYTKEVALKAHTLVSVDKKDATCTEDGHNAYEYCTKCEYSTKVVAPALNHSWTDATCTAPKTCATCGETEGEELGHDYSEYVTSTAGNCQTKKTTTYKCSRCDSTNVEVGELGDHSFTNYTSDGNATCAVDGTKTALCDVCNTEKHTVTDEGSKDAVAHTEATREENRNEATCGADGSYDLVTYCSVCKKVLNTEAKTITATGNHTYEWVIDTEATCGATGLKHEECTVCDATRSESTVIEATGEHTEATREENRNEATCGAPGSYDLVTYCSVCNTVINTEAKTIPATGAHNYATEVEGSRVDSTCNTKGSVTLKCACGATEVQTLDLDTTNHEGYNTEINRVPSTCSTKGSVTTKCACGDTKTTELELDEANHEGYTPVVTAPTCEADGYTTYTCACGDSYTDDEVSATGHDMVETEAAVDPTCTEDGKTAVLTCANNCGKTEGGEVVPSTGHDYEAVVTAPTCEADGYTTYTCACGDTYTDDEVSATGHDMVEKEAAVAPTCTEDGKTAVLTCANNCGKTEGGEVVPSTGHNHEAVVTAPTCEADGYTTYTCSCGDTYTADVVAALDHDWADATCTAPKTCKREGCGKTEGDVLGHNFGEWEVIKAATCTAEGEQRRDCSRCDAFETKVIEKTAHTPVPGEYKAPTCISEGYEGATICDVCKVEITAGKPIDKLAHEFGNTPVQVIPENCTYEATYVYKCKFCTETNKVGGEAKPEGDKGPHTIVELEKIEPTCDTAGIYSYYCSTCGSTVKTETIDPIGHADKDGDGYCDNCGGKYFDPNNQSVCTCLCHKESGFMKFLYKIANFFWKLFKINKSCACGYVHY